MKRALILLALSAFASADVKIKSKMTVSGQAMESTAMVKGARQRTEMEIMPGMKQVTIYQCDKKQMIQLNDRCKVYMVTPLEEESTDTAAAPPAPTGTQRAARGTQTKKGGVVTMTTTMKDTGERKKFFGYDARHILSSMTSESSPDACQKQQMDMTTDGWYIDFPGAQIGCASDSSAAVRMRPTQASCRDEMKFKRSGSARIGYPVQVETSMKGENGQTFTIRQEVTELTNATLDAAIFEVPAGYREVNDQQALMCMGDMAAMMRGARQAQSQVEDGDTTGGEGEGEAQTTRATRPKRAGKVRVGLVKFQASNDAASAAAETLRNRLIVDLEEVGAEAVALDVNATDPRDQIEKACREQQCDYLLYNELALTAPAAAKGNAGKKLGGFLSKAAGVATGNVPTPTFDASFKFRLFDINDPNVRLESVATGAGQSSSAEASATPALEQEATDVMVQIKKDAEERRRGLRK